MASQRTKFAPVLLGLRSPVRLRCARWSMGTEPVGAPFHQLRDWKRRGRNTRETGSLSLGGWPRFTRKAPPATGERIVGGAKNHGLNGLIQKRELLPVRRRHGRISARRSDHPIHIKTAVYLDGRIIGEVVSSELARLSTFPRQAAYSDPYVAYAAPDYNSLAGISVKLHPRRFSAMLADYASCPHSRAFGLCERGRRGRDLRGRPCQPRKPAQRRMLAPRGRSVVGTSRRGRLHAAGAVLLGTADVPAEHSRDAVYGEMGPFTTATEAWTEDACICSDSCSWFLLFGARWRT